MMPINTVDKIIGEVDAALRTLMPPPLRASLRRSPASGLDEVVLDNQARQHSAGLMRVNHAGEVCAQALYQGQALTAQLADIKEQMQAAAIEETDHLAWCEIRLQELGASPSLFNPLWYAGSFVLGALAGLAGDTISLGFVAETEKQVSAHLQKHQQIIAKEDHKTQAILKQMQDDEEQHAAAALQAGGIVLPYAVRQLMSLVSKIMTKSSYHW